MRVGARVVNSALAEACVSRVRYAVYCMEDIVYILLLDGGYSKCIVLYGGL